METVSNPIGFIKANKSLLGKGFKVSSLAGISEEEMSTLIDTIRNHPDFSEPEITEKENDKIIAVPTAVDNSYELETEKGEKVMVFKAPYIGRTTGGGFKFKFKESAMMTQSAALSSLNIRKPISVGEEFIFKVESLKYNPKINMFEGALAYFANEMIVKITNHAKDSKAYKKDKTAMYILDGWSKEEAALMMREESKKELDNLKKPTLTL